jgi:hypothetical protein
MLAVFICNFYVSMTQRIAAWLHYVVICALAAWGLFLVTTPRHYSSADAHHGMMAIAPGILLILLGLFALGAGFLMRRRSEGDYIGPAASSILVLAAVIFLALR